MSEEDRQVAESLVSELADLARDMNAAIATGGSEGVPALRVLIERGNLLLKRPEIIDGYRNETLGPDQSPAISIITILLLLRELAQELDQENFYRVERLAELCLELGSSLSMGLGSSAFQAGEDIGGHKQERKAAEQRSQKSKAAADARHSKPGGARERRASIQNIWASGKYQSRDVCAEEEWRGLGFGSYKAARNALVNQPNPKK